MILRTLQATLPAILAVWVCTLPTTSADYGTWTVTEYYISTVVGDDSFSAYYRLKPEVTPTAESTISVSTYTNYDVAIDVVQVTLAASGVAESDLAPTNTDTGALQTTYVAKLEIPAASSCTNQFTITTTTELSLPDVARSMVTPVSSTTNTYTLIGDSTAVTYFLPLGAVPLRPEATTANFAYEYYAERCVEPFSLDFDYGNEHGDDDILNDTQVCTMLTGCTSLKIWIIAVATVIPTLFLLGILESFFWFRRLMHGRRALRFGTLCWVLISPWVLCLTRQSQERPQEDRAGLGEQWKSFGVGRKLRLWLKWGFRWSYPEELLGTDPRKLQQNAAEQKKGVVSEQALQDRT